VTGWTAMWAEMAPRLRIVGLGLGAIAATFLGLAVLGRIVRYLFNRLVPQGRKERVLSVVGYLVLTLMVGGVIVGLYRSGTEVGIGLEASRRHVSEAGAEGLAQEVGNQSERLRALAEESAKLLESLDRTERMVGAARQDLEAVVMSARGQLAAVDSANSSIGELAARERELANQANALQRLLGGRAPITKDDLERSSRQGQWTGFVAGIVASVLAAMLLGGVRAVGAWAKRLIIGGR